MQKKNLAKKINDWGKEKIREIKNKLKERMDGSNDFSQTGDLHYKTGSRLNLTIQNFRIDTISNKKVIIREAKTNNNLITDNPNKSLALKSYCSDNDFDSLFLRFDFIEDLYSKNKYGEVFEECILLMKSLMSCIAMIYKFNFKILDDFIITISNLNPGKQFLISNELIMLNRIQKDHAVKYGRGNLTHNFIEQIYNITKKIVSKLKTQWNENLDKNFYDVQDLSFLERS